MTASFVTVDPESPLPPYAQIVGQLRAAIRRKEIKPGHILPSVRQLAGDLFVAPNTVARAYQELQDEGWLTSDGRRGTRVAETPPASDQRRARTQELKEAAKHFVAHGRSLGFSDDDIKLATDRALG